jgi:hypothetical protein
MDNPSVWEIGKAIVFGPLGVVMANFEWFPIKSTYCLALLDQF